MNRAIRALEQAEAKIIALELRRDEPIAIVGLGCRFPQGRSPGAFWRSLDAGVDAVSEIPASRWRSDAALRKARWAALLDDEDVAGFDAGFFGVSGREATAIDPQQRLFLAVAVEALEDAGITLESVRGSRTGVFVGMMTLDYQQLSMEIPADKLDIYTSTGIGACFGSGRVSYLLGLEGPSVSTDTACSSSLVALHLACQSLRARECELAVAGGVNLMLSPWTMHLFVHMQALSPEGRCRTFDAGSNGFVRGEGCGAIVLKRLSDALRDGDSIRAVVRGSAVNHNGRSSSLTAPSVLSQQALLRQALTAAQVQPHDIDYIEAHGIGTPLGDPVELEALKAVIGAPRADGSTCVVGSVKTNVGHLEAAAGIAGIIKTVLALEHERLPPHLHFEALNPRISLEGSALTVAGGGRAWPRTDRPRRAGVSAFGLSGANAHVVLEEAPAPARSGAANGAVNAALDDDAAQPHVVVVTARSEASLRRLATHYAATLEQDTAPSVRDVAYTTTVRRSHHPHRLAVVATTQRELAVALRQWLDGGAPPHVHAGRAFPGGAKLVFVYAGEASYRRGMGGALEERSDAFRDALNRCQDVFSALGATWSLRELLGADAAERPGLVEPAVFAIQVAMTAAWQAAGLVPDRVVGHGIGELAAAHAAGILSLEAAAEVIVRRCAWIARRTRLGPPPHGASLDDLAGELETTLPALVPAAGQLPLFSTVTGQRARGETLGARYWARNLCEPARLHDALAQALEGEPSVVVHVNADPGLASVLSEVVAHPERRDRVRVVGSPRPDAPARGGMLDALAEVFVAGGAVAWPGGGQARGQLARLPTYAWELERHWIQRSERPSGSGGSGALAGAPGARPDGAAAPDHRASPLLVQTWQPRPRGDSPGSGEAPCRRPAPGGRWLIVSARGEDDPSARLSAELRAAGHAVTTWQWEDHAEVGVLEAALATAFADDDARGIVVCAGSDRSLADADADGAMVQAVVERACWEVLALARVAARRRWRRAAPRLWLLTASSQPVSSDGELVGPGIRGADASLYGAALWGVGRTIGLEHPELRCTRLDLEPDSDPALVAAELLRDAADEELGLRGTSWHVGRLERINRAPSPARGANGARREPARGRPFRLELDRAGILDDLTFRVMQVPPPGLGQVRVRVASAGLNFMDVMTAMGIYPGAETGGPDPIVLGGECAGLVDAVGPGVTAFSVGDPVVAVGRGCFGSFLTTDAAYVHRRPAALDATLAGGVPIVFLTAWYALLTLGRLQAGERVLIHSAATGVGLAAVQIARWRGAEIHATAGTEDKRALLRQLGLATVMDSRTQAFADEVREATGGAGVDLVLNSLSGASIEASLAALASDGRFFEIGKTDIYNTDRALQLSPFRKRISYQAVDLLGLAQDRPARFAALFAEVMDAFAAGVLRPLPTVAFAAAETTTALRQMASGRHTGKLVVTIAGSGATAEVDAEVEGEIEVEVEVGRSAAPVIDAHASYLVTGGSGALGSALTEWLVEQGARHVVWLGRRGLAGARASGAAQREALRSRGVELTVCAGDVSRAADVAGAVAAAEAMGPLRGVIHAAGVHDDAIVQARDRAGLSAVMTPKVAGAWNVHRATERAPLDFFVMCSSASALLGAPGRAGDAAANAFLDGLARHRRRRGQVALSVQWGPVAAGTERSGLAGAGGMHGIEPREAGQMLRALLAAGAGHAGVIRFHARQWIETFPHLAGGTRFLPLVTGGDEPRHGGDPEMLARFARASASERALLVEQRICQELAQVLHTGPEGADRDPRRARLEVIDPELPFKSLGVDSLMGLELRNRLEAALGISLSAALIWAYPDLRSLREYLLGRLIAGAAPGAEPPGAPDAPDAPDRRDVHTLRQLSDDQRAALLEQELEAIERLLQ